MQVNVEQIVGIWDLGYSLDKHTIKSTPIGCNEYGHMQFDTLRPEVGEALFQLKYRSDYDQVPVIAAQMYEHLVNKFGFVSFIIPMPPSKQRQRQPVTEISRELARLMQVPCLEDMLVKTKTTQAMKDIVSREEKIEKLIDAFTVNKIVKDGLYDILIVDDLFDTGSSLEAATRVLRSCKKIRKIYTATVTRKR